MWRHLCGPRGGGNTGTCAVPVVARALGHAASPRPILASPRERELRQRTRHAPHDHRCGACDRHPRSHCCLYRLQSTPWILCGSRLSLLTEETKPCHHTGNQDFDPYDGPGVPPLGLGFGTWFWYFLGVGFGVGTFLLWDLKFGIW